jgi:hypothetical protein
MFTSTSIYVFPPQAEIQRPEACAFTWGPASDPGLPERSNASIIGTIAGNKKEVISGF